MNKKTYMNPQVEVIELQYRHILSGSGDPKTVKRLSSGNVFEEGVQSDEDYEGDIR